MNRERLFRENAVEKGFRNAPLVTPSPAGSQWSPILLCQAGRKIAQQARLQYRRIALDHPHCIWLICPKNFPVIYANGEPSSCARFRGHRNFDYRSGDCSCAQGRDESIWPCCRWSLPRRAAVFGAQAPPPPPPTTSAMAGRRASRFSEATAELRRSKPLCTEMMKAMFKEKPPRCLKGARIGGRSRCS